MFSYRNHQNIILLPAILATKHVFAFVIVSTWYFLFTPPPWIMQQFMYKCLNSIDILNAKNGSLYVSLSNYATIYVKMSTKYQYSER